MYLGRSHKMIFKTRVQIAKKSIMIVSSSAFLSLLFSCQFPSYQPGGASSLPSGPTTMSPPKTSPPSRSTSSGDGSQPTSGGQGEMPNGQTGGGNASGDFEGSSMEELDGALEDSLDGFDDTLAGKSGKEAMDVIDILTSTGRISIESDTEIAPLSESGGMSIENEDYDIESKKSAPKRKDNKRDKSTSSDSPTDGAGSRSNLPNVPEDIGDGQGDDVVLRQIREAALKETNPILREKLWDEYRKIKGIQSDN